MPSGKGDSVEFVLPVNGSGRPLLSGEWRKCAAPIGFRAAILAVKKTRPSEMSGLFRLYKRDVSMPSAFCAFYLKPS